MKLSNNVPKLRFPEFTEDWEQRKLGEVVEKVKSYSLSRNVETEEFTGFKYIHYGDIHRGIANIIHSDEILPDIQTGNFELLKQGDLVLADASEDYEGIGASCVIDCFLKNNLVAGLHTIAIRPIKTDHLFLYYLLNTQTFKQYGRFVGTGTKVVAISPTNLLKFKTNIPTNPAEQTTIGNFFCQVDKLIALHQGQLDRVKTLKKGLLQKMFPQQGETVPQLRFPQFTDAWEQRKLGEVVEISSGYTGDVSLNDGLFALTRIETISNGDVNENKVGYSNEKPNAKYLLNKGDILFSNINSLSHIGKTAIYQNDTKLFHGTNLLRLQSKNKVFPYFLYYQLNTCTKLNWAKSHANQAVNQVSINQTELKRQKLSIPTLAEQTTIGNFFRQLDKLITLHQRKLEHLKTLKKALLQQMFV